jgi:hypothetical protein
MLGPWKEALPKQRFSARPFQQKLSTVIFISVHIPATFHYGLLFVGRTVPGQSSVAVYPVHDVRLVLYREQPLFFFF